eukprot:7553078-Pyramimonas_sp.AAC.2
MSAASDRVGCGQRPSLTALSSEGMMQVWHPMRYDTSRSSAEVPRVTLLEAALVEINRGGDGRRGNGPQRGPHEIWGRLGPPPRRQGMFDPA